MKITLDLKLVLLLVKESIVRGNYSAAISTIEEIIEQVYDKEKQKLNGRDAR